MTCASLSLLYDHRPHRSSFWINPTGFIFWGLSGIYFLFFFLKLLSLLFASGRIILSHLKQPLFPWSCSLHLLFDWHKVYSQTLRSGISSTRFWGTRNNYRPIQSCAAIKHMKRVFHRYFSSFIISVKYWGWLWCISSTQMHFNLYFFLPQSVIYRSVRCQLTICVSKLVFYEEVTRFLT